MHCLSANISIQQFEIAPKIKNFKAIDKQVRCFFGSSHLMKTLMDKLI